MPTEIPVQSRHATVVQRLSWPDLTRFTILLLRVRWLNRRLVAAHARVERQGLDAAGPALLFTAQRWMEAHEAMSALLGTPELPEVMQVRAMLRVSAFKRHLGVEHLPAQQSEP